MKNLIDIKRILKAIVNALHALKLLIDDIPVPGGTGGISYTTEEQDTGLTWIDGRPIYQKTYSVTSPSGNTATNLIEITSESIDFIVEDALTLTASWTSSGKTFGYNSTGTGNPSVAGQLVYKFNPNGDDKDYVTVTLGSETVYRSKPLYLTIRYVKKASE